MSRWFVKVDISSRSVQIISTYLRAIDYYHELNAMYTEKGRLYMVESCPGALES